VVRWERNEVSIEAPTAKADLYFDGFARWRFSDTTVFGVRGEATRAGFARVFQEFLSEPTPNVLWDMREYPLSRLAHHQLRSLVSQLMRSDLSRRPAGRSAFVCNSEADHVVMRILIAYAEANDYRIELAAFREIDEARRWLSLSAVPSKVDASRLGG
jgi:hypothetical protein